MLCYAMYAMSCNVFKDFRDLSLRKPQERETLVSNFKKIESEKSLQSFLGSHSPAK